MFLEAGAGAHVTEQIFPDRWTFHCVEYVLISRGGGNYEDPTPARIGFTAPFKNSCHSISRRDSDSTALLKRGEGAHEGGKTPSKGDACQRERLREKKMRQIRYIS